MKTLICGSGPAAIQFAVLVNNFFQNSEITFLSRASVRNLEYKKLMQNNELRFVVEASRTEITYFEGNAEPSNFCTHVDEIKNTFDLVILAQPTFEYCECVEILANKKLLSKNVNIITVSSRIGISEQVSTALKALNVNYGLVTFSDYIAVSVRDKQDILKAITSDEKKLIEYCVSGTLNEKVHAFVADYIKKFVPSLTEAKCSWQAEQANTNLFHLPIIIHESLTEWFFNPSSKENYFYGPYPWGAYSYNVISQIIQFEDELQSVYRSLNLSPVNFFKFRMERASLPITEINPELIQNYPNLDANERQAMHTLFLWMTERKRMGVNIDKESISLKGLPRFPKIKINENLVAELPRIPLEDYISLLGILKFSQTIGLDLPICNSLSQKFSNYCITEPLKYNYSLNFKMDCYQSSIESHISTLLTKYNQ